MTTVEILRWLGEHYLDEDVFEETFGKDYTMRELVNIVGAEEAVRKIEEYEANKRKDDDKWKTHDGCKECCHEDLECDEYPCRACKGTTTDLIEKLKRKDYYYVNGKSDTEWVYKVECEYGYLYVESEDEAIDLCEKWARNYHTSAEYHKVCREKVE